MAARTSPLSSQQVYAMPSHISPAGMAVSQLASRRHASSWLIARHQHSRLTKAVSSPSRNRVNHYHTNAIKYKTIARIVNTSQQLRQASSSIDTANPPASTRPPRFTKPQRGNAKLFTHLWNQAKAFGSFYKAGIKAILANRKLAAKIRETLVEERQSTPDHASAKPQSNTNKAVSKYLMTRADYQLICRSEHDMKRVPLFVVLVALLGEWLPLILPFAPRIQPLTCRLPDVVAGMRRKTEERRQTVFRQGIKAPEMKASDKPIDLSYHRPRMSFVKTLSQDQLYHLSVTLNLHGPIWERSTFKPPKFMLRQRVADRIGYLVRDDMLLNEAGGAAKLIPDELRIACEERGLDVLGPSHQQLLKELNFWLQKQDVTKGKAMLPLLFSRPNVWAELRFPYKRQGNED